jgi:endonuclease III
MSQLTVELVPASKVSRQRMRWLPIFSSAADRLVASYGIPSLGNFRNPVREIFYIVLSARTTDEQYRKTYRNLHARFPALEDLANTTVKEIVSCIAKGGLANKRAAQVRDIARTLLSEFGNDPSRRLRRMSAREVFAFLTNLPGMGPKSALCVMMYSLGHDTFPVDVNVQRIAARFGVLPARLKHWQAQQRLPAFVPEGRSKELHIGLVVHGRSVCLPRKPRCEICVLSDLCDHGKKQLNARKKDGPP